MESLSVELGNGLAAEDQRLDMGLLLLAAERAAEQGTRLITVLEELTGLGPRQFVQRLGSTLHYPVLSSEALFACQPDFERVSLALALKREFLIVQLPGGNRVGVFSDPFDAIRLAWIDEFLQGALLYLVHADDLAGFLAR